MKLIFWQNMISQHLFPIIQGIKEVNSDIDVLLVVEKEFSTERLSQGWGLANTDGFNGCIIVNPSIKEIEGIYTQNEKAIHIFSGIRSNQLVFNSLKISYNYDVERCLISESPTFYRIPKFMHYLKSLFYDRKYIRRFDKVFAIGKDAIDWFSVWINKSENIVPFSYCVNDMEYGIVKVNRPKDELKCVFVGRLVKLKGLDKALLQVAKFTKGITLDIIGEGPEMLKLKQSVLKSVHIKFKGKKSNVEIRESLKNYDVLILPSYYDGWGAVVNEALMAGCYVIVSDKCGASDLIKENFNGNVFSHKGENEIYNCLYTLKENIENLRSERFKILEWSERIKRKELARYFLKSLMSNEQIIPPWKVNK